MNIGTAKYGMPAAAAGAPEFTVGAGASNGAVATPRGLHGRLDPENPLLWLFGIAAATLGLAAVSVSGRIGPLHVSGGIGK